MKKRKKGALGRRMLLLLCLVMAIAAVLFSPLFQIGNIECTEMKQYTQSQICDKIGLSEGMNITAFSSSRAEKILLEDPYIASVKISRRLPSTVKIEIEERRVRGYVPYKDSYLFIDEYGRVLDVQTYFKDSLPVVEGLEFDEFQLGELLLVSNQESFDVIVKMAQLMTKYELLDIVVRVDVGDPQNIVAYVNKIEVKLGDISDSDEKVRTMAEIVRQIPETDRGTLDLSDMSKPLVFKYLT